LINQKLTFNDDYIAFSSNWGIEHVMMDWEDNLMKEHAKIACYNKGDILEFGFGMGISATYIQSHNPKSHTIIEIHPQVIERAKLWALDKPSVKIIEGDWFKCLDQLSKYDGIFFDTYGDNNHKEFGQIAESLTKPGAHVTWWNAISKPENVYGFKDVTYTKYNVDPPENSYFNDKGYFLPLKVYL